MKYRVSSVLPAILFLCLHPVAAEEGKISSFGLVAKVNGVAISSVQFERNFEEYVRDNNINVAAIRYPERIKKFKRELLDNLINAELFWQAAQKQKMIANASEVEKIMNDVRSQFKSAQELDKKLVAEGYTQESYQQHLQRMASARKYLDYIGTTGNEINDQTIHEFYVNNPEKFDAPEMVRAKHILLKTTTKMNTEEKQVVHKKIQEILTKARSGEDFTKLAQAHSEDSSASNGGDLGFFSQTQMVKPFADMAFSLKAGDISDIVETQFGLHIIKVEEIRPPGKVAERIVRDYIRQYLQTANKRKAVEQEVKRLRADADIQIYLSL